MSIIFLSHMPYERGSLIFILLTRSGAVQLGSGGSAHTHLRPGIILPMHSTTVNRIEHWKRWQSTCQKVRTWREGIAVNHSSLISPSVKQLLSEDSLSSHVLYTLIPGPLEVVGGVWV